jgi:hypothetical protein
MVRHLFVVTLALAVAGCNHATAPSTAVQVTQPGAKSTQDFHLTIMATDDDGAPVTNAKVSVEFVGGQVLGATKQVLGATDGAGSYHLDFTAAVSFIGEPFPEGVAAFAWVDKPGYEGDVQYIRATGPTLSSQFHMHLSKRIAAGESTLVTVGPGDPVCYNNGQDDHPMPPPNEWVCRAVLVVVPVDGTLTVEAIPTQPGEPLSGLEIQDDNHWQISYREPRLSIPVTAGTEVLANVEIPWGSAGPLSFTLRTSLAAQGASGLTGASVSIRAGCLGVNSVADSGRPTRLQSFLRISSRHLCLCRWNRCRECARRAAVRACFTFLRSLRLLRVEGTDASRRMDNVSHSSSGHHRQARRMRRKPPNDPDEAVITTLTR